MTAPTTDLATLTKAQAYGLGFDLVGITALGPSETAAAYDQWIAEGRHGTMEYLARGREKRHDSRLPYPGAVTAIVVAMNYGGREPSGPVARYARGDDYHDVMVDRLNALHRWIEERAGTAIAGKAYVDTGPILERDLARRAGLGWQAKNTNLIHPQLGSFFFIGALLVGVELAHDAPFEGDRCGTCTRCIDACPTGAITAPRELDATRCISYLTIELKGEIEESLRPGIGGLVYGCDICQEVCPWNVRFSRELAEDSPFRSRFAVSGERSPRELARWILGLSQEEFSAAFRKSPMKRAKLRGLKRNAAVVLRNVGTADDVDVLTRALGDEEPLVCEHAVWALARRRADVADPTPSRATATRPEPPAGPHVGCSSLWRRR